MDIVLIRTGLLIIGLLGFLHLIYTFADLKSPKKFVPTDENLLPLLQNTGVRLVRNPWPGRSFWGAYMGFNLSHSLGILVFVTLYLVLSFIAPSVLFHPALVAILIGTGCAYVVTARIFWFSIPFYGATLSTFLTTLGVVLHFI